MQSVPVTKASVRKGDCLYRTNCTPVSVRARPTVRTETHTYRNAPPERHFSIVPCPCICKAYKAHPLFLSLHAVQKSLFCAIHHHAIPVILPGALLCLQMPDTCVLYTSKWRPEVQRKGWENYRGLWIASWNCHIKVWNKTSVTLQQSSQKGQQKPPFGAKALSLAPQKCTCQIAYEAICWQNLFDTFIATHKIYIFISIIFNQTTCTRDFWNQEILLRIKKQFLWYMPLQLYQIYIYISLKVSAVLEETMYAWLPKSNFCLEQSGANKLYLSVI